jgi:hypothetical protein
MSGLSFDEVMSYYSKAKDDLCGVFEILNPMMGKENIKHEVELKPSGYTDPIITNHAIHERDKWMVQTSDIVFVDFTGAKSVSIGCCMELAWADILGKHTVVVLDKDDIHKHAFVLDTADIIFESYDDAVGYLTQFGG